MTNPIAQVRGISRDGQHYEALVFWCPGCEFDTEEHGKQGGAHMLPITGSGPGVGDQPSWTFNGDAERPTLSPSILSKVPHRRVNGEVAPLVCHSFLRGGQLEFLSDCTHQYAGQTVPLPPLPDWLVKES